LLPVATIVCWPAVASLGTVNVKVNVPSEADVAVPRVSGELCRTKVIVVLGDQPEPVSVTDSPGDAVAFPSNDVVV
jgi:Zn-dependent alcohol dehydrogenase